MYIVKSKCIYVYIVYMSVDIFVYVCMCGFVINYDLNYFKCIILLYIDNPVKEINDTWTACWDKEAGAIYYYNQITGEATWIPPDNI